MQLTIELIIINYRYCETYESSSTIKIKWLKNLVFREQNYKIKGWLNDRNQMISILTKKEKRKKKAIIYCIVYHQFEGVYILHTQIEQT